MTGRPIRPVHLRTGARVAPLGIDAPAPELSWRLETDATGVTQTGYRVQVALGDRFDGEPLWDSGETASDTPFGVRYAGPPLESGRRYRWRVRVTATADGPLAPEWSEPAWFETAVLDPARWRASWICGPAPASKRDDPVLYLRGDLPLAADVVRARAYVSALGWYRLFVNGADLTGDAQVPRWTPLSEMVEYQVYDVTDALRRGGNVVAIAVGDGRYRGGLGLTGVRGVYGSRIAAFAQLEVEHADGTTVTWTTDGSWSAGPGRITGSDPKNGERIDLRVPDADWLTDPRPPARFAPALLLADQRHPLVAEEVERVRDVAYLPAVVSRTPSGAQLLDFGQNFAGVVRIRLRGPAGAEVRLTHTELLTPDGEVDTKSFAGQTTWYQRDVVTLSGADEQVRPWFTIHGFRYVEVVGLDAAIDPADVEGVVLSSDLAPAGSFSCSDPRLEQLHRNVRWSVVSNFTDTPTDCPTRERAGWTGDIQAFAPTAAVLVDAQAFLARYLRNLAVEQWDDGVVPIYVPSQQRLEPGIGRRMIHFMSGAVGWSDAAVLLPWTVHRYYGDRALLERQYPSMRKRVEGMRVVAAKRRGGRFVLAGGFHFGEWLRPGENPLTTIAAHLVRPPAEIATAYFAHSTTVLAEAAEVLGRDDEARRYRRLAERVRAAWRAAFVRDDGRLALDRQDDYVRALAFDLVLPEQRPAAVDRLVALIEAAGTHLGTGFLSTPMLLQVLVAGGRADVALALLLQTSSPSWLHQIERGATTVWETWEGYRPDGRGKESHNHYALGTVALWLTEGLAGITPAAPGYRRIAIAPTIAAELDRVEAAVQTPFGQVASAWHWDGDDVVLQVRVPAGAEAEVHGDWTADGASAVVGSGEHRFTRRRPVQRPAPLVPGAA